MFLHRPKSSHNVVQVKSLFFRKIQNYPTLVAYTAAAILNFKIAAPNSYLTIPKPSVYQGSLLSIRFTAFFF